MEKKFTQGEWEVGSLFAVVGIRKPKTLIVANCNHDKDINSSEQLANAKLIAAAPDLLEALEALLFMCNGKWESNGCKTFDEAESKALLSIKKALE